MYQANFTFLKPVQPKTVLQGILAKVALGEFVLARTPSTKPASQQATCPYRPYHVIDAGQNYAAETVAGPQLAGRPAVLTPVYIANPGMAGEAYAATAATPTLQYPANAPVATAAYPLQPPALTPAYPAEVAANPASAGRAADGAFAYAGEPVPASQAEPAKPATPGEQLPARKVECK